MVKAKTKKKVVKKSGRKSTQTKWTKFLASKQLIVLTAFICVFLIGLVLGIAVSTCLETKGDIVNLQKALQFSGNEDRLTVQAVKNVSPSVVSIVITKELKKITNLSGPDVFLFDDYFEFGWPQDLEPPEDGKQKVGMGTGFVVNSEKGLILTNKHVVSDEDAEYTVLTSDGQQYEAVVLDIDPFNDLAIIKIENGDLPAVSLGDSDDIEIGQTVIAIGYSLGEYKNTVTKGVVSGINRYVVAGNYQNTEVIDEAIQTDAAINPGNSGGPLINLQGQVIGISTAINRQGQSLGFAIPVNVAKDVVNSIEEFGRIVRPWLGVRYRMINKIIAEQEKLAVDYGALLVKGGDGQSAIFSDSPAEKAGLLAGDIILELNGQKLEGQIALGMIIKKLQPGDLVELLVLRGEEEELVFEVGLGEYSLDNY